MMFSISLIHGGPWTVHLRHRSLFHCRLFPFTQCNTEHAKIPNNAVEKPYREGPGCMQKAQAGQYVTQQSSWSCRSRRRAESTKHENWKGKCAESGLSHIAHGGTWRWKENPPAGGNRGKPGSKHMWSMLDGACQVWLEGCSLAPPAAWSSTPMKILLSPSRSEKWVLMQNLLQEKWSFRSVKMTWKSELHSSNNFTL